MHNENVRIKQGGKNVISIWYPSSYKYSKVTRRWKNTTTKKKKEEIENLQECIYKVLNRLDIKVKRTWRVIVQGTYYHVIICSTLHANKERFDKYLFYEQCTLSSQKNFFIRNLN